MNREPSSELRAAAEDLFAACRGEQPSAELQRRIAALCVSDLAHSEVRPSVRRSSRFGTVRWLTAALVLSLGGGAAWLSLRAPAPRIAIGAEQRPADPAREAPPVASSSAPIALEGEAPEPIEPAPFKAPARSKPRPPAPTVATPVVVPPEPAAPKLNLAQDLQELMRIRSTLRAGNGAQALEILDQRARRGGELEAEATLLRIEALASVGRRTEASELARRFVRANPNSALADRAKAFAQ
jgi:hypothetical protein